MINGGVEKYDSPGAQKIENDPIPTSYGITVENTYFSSPHILDITRILQISEKNAKKPSNERGFAAVGSDIDKGDAGTENGLCLSLSGRLRVNADSVGHGGAAAAGQVDIELENRAVRHLVLKRHFVHGARDKRAAWEFPGCCQPGKFIHPKKELAAEQVTEMVEMFGSDKRVCGHGSVPPTRLFHVKPRVFENTRLQQQGYDFKRLDRYLQFALAGLRTRQWLLEQVCPGDACLGVG
jgi:hypothetical protein